MVGLEISPHWEGRGEEQKSYNYRWYALEILRWCYLGHAKSRPGYAIQTILFIVQQYSPNRNNIEIRQKVNLFLRLIN
jgi:hypothetical protein